MNTWIHYIEYSPEYCQPHPNEVMIDMTPFKKIICMRLKPVFHAIKKTVILPWYFQLWVYVVFIVWPISGMLLPASLKHPEIPKWSRLIVNSHSTSDVSAVGSTVVEASKHHLHCTKSGTFNPKPSGHSTRFATDAMETMHTARRWHQFLYSWNSKKKCRNMTHTTVFTCMFMYI